MLGMEVSTFGISLDRIIAITMISYLVLIKQGTDVSTAKTIFYRIKTLDTIS